MSDTSFYNNGSNALTNLQSSVGVLGGLNQNRLFQQEFAGRKAMGDIYSQSIDPNTGQFNPAIALELAKNNPNASFVLPQIIQQGLERNHQQIANQQSAAQLYMQHAPILQAEAMEIANNANVTQKDVQKSLVGLVDNDTSNPTPGKISAQEAVKLMQQYSALGDDSDSIRNLARQQSQQLEVTMKGARAVLPEMSYQDVGGQKVPVNTNPMSGGFNANQPLRNTLPPTTPMFDPSMNNGKGGTVYKGQIEDQAMNEAGKDNAINASDLTQPDIHTGLQAAPPPGFVHAADAAAGDNASQAMTLQRAAATVPQQKALLGNMEAKLGDFSSGPASSAWKGFLAGAQQIVPGLNSMKSVASQEDFNKMAGMIAQQQFQSLGGTGTDSKLDSAMSTSPNSFLSERGNKEIIHLLKGNADAIGAMNSEWQRAQQPISQGGRGLSNQDFGKFQAQFNQQYDPRAFQLQYMTPTERKELLKGMTPTEQDKFKNSVNVAGENGWIPDPRKTNAQ